MANGTAVRVFLDALASASVGAAVGAAVLLGVRVGADRLTTWRLHHVEARNCERCAAMVRRTRDGAERDLNDACSTLDELEKCAFYVRRHGETFYSEKNAPLAHNANRVPYKQRSSKPATNAQIQACAAAGRWHTACAPFCVRCVCARACLPCYRPGASILTTIASCELWGATCSSFRTFLQRPTRQTHLHSLQARLSGA